ncbi:MAG: chorismate-binding protein [Actinobacteria bacterium]|nr:chorismate-binding protein [Actinomycetota bacterium]
MSPPTSPSRVDAAPVARFDDRVARRSLVFDRALDVLVAECPSEVVEVLAAVEAANRRGLWAAGYVSYEAAGGFDPSLVTHARDEHDPPLAWFAIAPEARRIPYVAPLPSGERRLPGWSDRWSTADLFAAIATVRARIAAGETYQCNLTTRLTSELGECGVGELYAHLLSRQRTRYAARLDVGTHEVASVSPELFFDWHERTLLTRPMKGTSPRGRTPIEDERLRRALCSNAKERAENVMIVDLLRNDVSKIATPGSVRVTRLCVAERYETVWQLTSDVEATLASDVRLVEIFRALFPCGSVTGAPKASTMRLIRELEPAPRGVYCGAIGWVAPIGHARRARFSVAIRTITVARASGGGVYGVGAGITWDSDPASEALEFAVKADVLYPVEQPPVAGPIAPART